MIFSVGSSESCREIAHVVTMVYRQKDRVSHGTGAIIKNVHGMQCFEETAVTSDTFRYSAHTSPSTFSD
jgi:hypothetical protein